MAKSEAKEFLDKFLSETNISSKNSTLTDAILVGIGTAIVLAIESLREYKGDLNDFRISVSDLRNLSIQMMQSGANDIGLEDLLHALRTLAIKR